jgi:hypothetical protein
MVYAVYAVDYTSTQIKIMCIIVNKNKGRKDVYIEEDIK